MNALNTKIHDLLREMERAQRDYAQLAKNADAAVMPGLQKLMNKVCSETKNWEQPLITFLEGLNVKLDSNVQLDSGIKGMDDMHGTIHFWMEKTEAGTKVIRAALQEIHGEDEEARKMLSEILVLVETQHNQANQVHNKRHELNDDAEFDVWLSTHVK